MDDSRGFFPHGFPRPNMLVQSGTKVLIKGLASQAVRKPNGRTGTALNFYPDRDGRWSVELDQDENSEQQLEEPEEKGDGTAIDTTGAKKESNGKLVLIRIINLELVLDKPIYFCVLKRENVGWAAMSEGGSCILRAGTFAGNADKPALCVLEGRDGGCDTEQIYRVSRCMGVERKAIQSFVGKVMKEGLPDNVKEE